MGESYEPQPGTQNSIDTIIELAGERVNGLALPNCEIQIGKDCVFIWAIYEHAED